MILDTFQRLDAVARDLIDRFGRDRLPENLFHYTSAEGLVGVARSKALWASDMLCLSDASEASYAHALIQAALETDDSQLVPPRHRSGFMEPLTESRMYTTFVACFRVDGDLLSQWRGYGRAGMKDLP